MNAVALSVDSIDPFLRPQSGTFVLDLFVKGVRCGHCVHKISQEIEKNPSIENYEFGSKGHRLKLWSSSRGALAETISTIQSLGFEAVPVNDDIDQDIEKQQYKKSLKQLAVAGVCAGNIMLFSTAIYLGADEAFKQFFHRLSFFLVLPVLLYSAQGIWYGFYQSLRNYRFNLDLPIGMALSLGFLLSSFSLLRGGDSIYFDSLAVVVFLVLTSRFILNRYVENIYQANIVQSIPGVYQIRKVIEGREVWRPLGGVQKGDLVKVLKGEAFPVDGRLVSTEALVDHSVLTGESKPESLKVGDSVFAGTRLSLGEALVEVSQEGQSTRVGQMIQKALESQKQQKEESFKLVSRFTGFVVLASLATFVGVSLTLGLEEAFLRSFAIIIVACPCAVSFGIPLIRSFTGQLALQEGFIIKRPQILETLLNTRRFCFDKTGTLTPSHVKIQNRDFEKLSLEDQNCLLSLEAMMDHPISRGFLELKTSRHQNLEVKNFKYRPGLGIEGEIQGAVWKAHSRATEGDQKILEIFVNDKTKAQISLDTDIKSGLASFFESLVNRGKKISILSGDTVEQVERVEKLIPLRGRDQFLAGATPEQKLKVVEEGGPCVMVGDGFNDLSAMKSATVSVCMPGALETNLNVADITMTRGDVRQLPQLLQLAEKVKKTERKLFGFTFLYNVICVGLAIGGFISPVVAAILMPISSISVLSLVILSLRRL